MKVVLPGGSGQIGTILARHFHAKGDDVVVIARRVSAAPWRMERWDGRTLTGWEREIDGADVVINLAGRSVNCRYNAENQREMMESRVDSTRAVGQAIERAARPPRVWLQSSTATIYAHRFDAPNDESTGIIGNGQGSGARQPQKWAFSVEIAKAWERTLEEARTPSTRKVALRSAMTMSPDKDGIFDVMMGLVCKGLGGKAGNGKQYVSWIHERDFIRAVEFLIERQDIAGAVNVCSPNPVTNAEFMRELRGAAGVRVGLPATAWMLEVGAVGLKTETELLLKSRRVIPKRLMDAGFGFEFAEWGHAASDLATRWREARARGS